MARPNLRSISLLIVVSVVTVLLTVTLLVINALDTPYHPGLGQLRPAAMERTLVILDEERQVVGDAAALPCDDEGVAR